MFVPRKGPRRTLVGYQLPKQNQNQTTLMRPLKESRLQINNIISAECCRWSS